MKKQVLLYTYANRKVGYQPAHSRSLNNIFAVHFQDGITHGFEIFKFQDSSMFVAARAGLSASHPDQKLRKQFAVKFLNFGMPEIFAVIYLKFKQRGQTLKGIFPKWCKWNRKQ